LTSSSSIDIRSFDEELEGFAAAGLEVGGKVSTVFVLEVAEPVEPGLAGFAVVVEVVVFDVDDLPEVFFCCARPMIGTNSSREQIQFFMLFGSGDGYYFLGS
jgi:hypothetical protein